MKRTLKALTLRLDSKSFSRLAAVAGTENRTPTNYVETLVLRDLEAKDETNRLITVYAVPETANLVHGQLERTTGETDERYAQRKALVDELMSIPDKG
jgi:hypothetical protein